MQDSFRQIGLPRPDPVATYGTMWGEFPNELEQFLRLTAKSRGSRFFRIPVSLLGGDRLPFHHSRAFAHPSMGVFSPSPMDTSKKCNFHLENALLGRNSGMISGQFTSQARPWPGLSTPGPAALPCAASRTRSSNESTRNTFHPFLPVATCLHLCLSVNVR